jgi:hypothetical protein
LNDNSSTISQACRSDARFELQLMPLDETPRNHCTIDVRILTRFSAPEGQPEGLPQRVCRSDHERKQAVFDRR